MANHPQFEALIRRDEILRRTAEIGSEVRASFGDHGEPLILCVALGGRVFCRHLLEHLERGLEVREVRCSSYGVRTESSGEVKIRGLEGLDLRGRDILVVEDIVDTGYTLSKLSARLEDLGAARVRTATLLSKPSRRVVEIDIEYIGFEVENHFVVGFGMDVAERFRDLPYVGVYDERLDPAVAGGTQRSAPA
ncbi:MAG: hypoxanthine phosphoribosyltransferase [Planctomycetota bacterium]